ncbi:MAG: hypothetical protein HXX10_25645 [Rhodoplanes sp.]|uniref:hypothetical protein n=1 Tax=Rhodoplanes sp. TaxID=1968906 RepID=UPI00184F195E|nr:hypothetical protein [Rhodoplanes sp.]NVO17426.1 hypothetical protein [Rhodoplanes sp.]
MMGLRIAMAAAVAAVPFGLPALAFDPPGARGDRGREVERAPAPREAERPAANPNPAAGRRPDGPPGPPPPGPPGPERPEAAFGRRDVIAPTTNVVAPTVVAPGAGATGVVVAPSLRGGPVAAPVAPPPSFGTISSGAVAASAGGPAAPMPAGAVRTLPDGSVSVVMEGAQYFRYGPTLYRAMVEGGTTVYVPSP